MVVGDEQINVVHLATDSDVLKFEILHVHDLEEEVAQVFPLIVALLAVVQKRVKKPRVKIDLIAGAAEYRKDVEVRPVIPGGLVPLIETASLTKEDVVCAVHALMDFAGCPRWDESNALPTKVNFTFKPAGLSIGRGLIFRCCILRRCPARRGRQVSEVA